MLRLGSTTLAVAGKDFCIVASSKAAMRGASILKSNDDKTRQLNKQTLMAFSGEPGDTGIFKVEFVEGRGQS